MKTGEVKLRQERVKALANSVVPQCSAVVGRMLKEVLEQRAKCA